MAIMQFSSLLNKDFIKLNVCSETKEDIYKELLSEICHKYKLPISCEALFDKIVERDHETSTVFPTEVAIPHVHVAGLNDAIIAIATPKTPLETEHGTVKMLIMVITDPQQSTLYLHILQCIIKLSKNIEFFNKLLEVKKPEEFINLVSKEDFALNKNVTVSDIMNTHIIYARPSMTLKELGNLFYNKNYNYTPVVDKTLKVIGEVTVLDLLMSSFPAYTNYLGNMQFVKTFEPFEKLLKEENNIKVSDIMQELTCKISPDSTLIEALFVMKKNKRRNLPVMIDNKIVGIISFSDIFRKIIKG
ncbi:MAG TPA: CBS domain-containing protein [Candidatus Cloacimonadota bacterium]|nr:CBS domain-containing protein [Candidatus Cloacimonadota bacterium]HQB41179.1 CBS domain-containing protein [Candidatus Cloacimonadota bacterium]